LRGIERLDRGKRAFDLKLGILEFYDFSSLKRSNVAPTLFVEVLVAEVLTQSRTPFAEP
jgi:hypothetical protein